MNLTDRQRATIETALDEMAIALGIDINKAALNGRPLNDLYQRAISIVRERTGRKVRSDAGISRAPQLGLPTT